MCLSTHRTYEKGNEPDTLCKRVGCPTILRSRRADCTCSSGYSVATIMISIAASKSPQYDCSDAYSGSCNSSLISRDFVTTPLYITFFFRFAPRLISRPARDDSNFSTPTIFIVIVLSTAPISFSFICFSQRSVTIFVVSKRRYSSRVPVAALIVRVLPEIRSVGWSILHHVPPTNPF